MIDKLRSLYHTIKRAVFWGWNLRNCMTFDSHSFYKFLSVQLRKLDVEMTNGYGVYTKKSQRKLLTAANLAERYYEENSINKAYDELKERWGDCKFIFGRNLINTWEKVNPHNEHIFKKDYRRTIKKHFEIDQTYKNELFKYLDKYLEGWWD